MIDLKFRNVSKWYRIRQTSKNRAERPGLISKLMFLTKRSQQFWALRDVSFEVESGESLGIIGHNGAGKSTILKLLSSITTPSRGEITIRGRLSALIEVGSGFHPELTGRENIYLNGSILGMRRREITDKLESIVEFAGIGQFLDSPVKWYSSGMYVRLGFSIAAHLDGDILLLDEVLAVGDAGFQAKCINRISELKQKQGKTIVFISHDLRAVERLCDRAILMWQGQVIADGAPREVITEYERATGTFSPSPPPGVLTEDGTKKAQITSIRFLDFDGQDAVNFCTGDPITVYVEYLAADAVEDAVIEVFFYSAGRELHCQLTTEKDADRIDLKSGPGALEFFCPELGLQPGIYLIDATIRKREVAEELDWQYRCATLRVDPGPKLWRGSFYMPHNWRLISEEGREAITTAGDHAALPVNSELGIEPGMT